MKNKLLIKIKNKNAKIGIIGLGYVGLPLVIRFTQEGFKTIGFDIDEKKVNRLNNNKTYIKNIAKKNIKLAVKAGFFATTDFSKISTVDNILICVPTPLGAHKKPDLSFIKNTLRSVKPYLKANQLLILESTSYPGTSEEEIVPVIEDAGFSIGENFFVGYSPEREDSGNKNFTTKTIPKIVSGHTKNCLEITKALYDEIVETTVPVSSTRVAEMTKILENVYRAVNIGLINELKMITDKLDIDIYEIIDAAATKPFGFTPYYPGPGLGGHCIPIDPFYLTWKAKKVGANTRFIKLAGEINAAMPSYVVQKVVEALKKIGKSIKNSKVLVLGLAYKKNVDDTRESPSLIIIEKLSLLGAIVKYSDPYLPIMPKTRKFNFNYQSVNLTPASIVSYDIIILATDHDDFDYKLIESKAKLIVDTRGRLRNSNKVIKA